MMSSFIAYFYPVEELKTAMKNIPEIISTIKNNTVYGDSKQGYFPESIVNVPDFSLFSVNHGKVKPIDILTLDGMKTIDQLRVIKSTIFYEYGIVTYHSTNKEDIATTKTNVEDMLDVEMNPQPLYLAEHQARKIKDEAEEVRSLQTKKVAGAEWASGSGRDFERATLNEIIDSGELYSFKMNVNKIKGVNQSVVFGITLTSKIQTPTKFTIFTRNLTDEEEAIAAHHLLANIIAPKCQTFTHFQQKLDGSLPKIAV